jgi:hypothetical protein
MTLALLGSSLALRQSSAAFEPGTTVYLPIVRSAAAQPQPGKLIFGIGPTASGAHDTRLAQEAPVRLLTTWYNGPSDLSWMAGWKNGLVPEAYAAGYALHVVVFTDDDEATIATSYGDACGRPYPLSDGFLNDIRELARIFAGAASSPPLYITMFTEFQTYACDDNAWNPNPQTNAYYRALKDRYRAALAIFHDQAPNAQVSLGWGGWQVRWDDAETGAGRSMFQHFADVMGESDFQSFQAMSSQDNTADIKAMVHTLGVYGPVMLAHYKPSGGAQATFEQDLRAMLTDDYLADVSGAGLFAWSFMDNKNLAASESIYQFVKDAVIRYGS